MQNYHANLKLKIAGLLAASVAFLPATSQAEEDAVFSVNIVGFQRQELPNAGGVILSAPPFRAAEANTLLDIFGTNTLKQSLSLFLCDQVILFDASRQVYERWAQSTDGKFYRANSLQEWNIGIEGNPVVPLGQGYWIRSASDASPDRSVTYVGNIILDEELSVEIVSGLQIISYPFSSNIDLQETAFGQSGAAQSDSLFLADSISVFEAGAYSNYRLAADGVWYKANSLSEWNQGIVATRTINAGDAVFYRARQAFTWSETNKYLNSVQD